MSNAEEQGPPMGLNDATAKPGYGNPPEKNRFKPGVSGNRKGRPRKKPADEQIPPSVMSDAVLKLARRPINPTINGQIQKMTAVEAVMLVIEQKALHGDVAAARLYLEHVSDAEQNTRKEHRRRFEKQVEYKRRLEREIHRATALGFEPPSPVPHPDEMLVDSKKERIVFNGPADDVEKLVWDDTEALRLETESAIAEMEEMLQSDGEYWPPYGNTREEVLRVIEDFKGDLGKLDLAQPTLEARQQPGFNLEKWREQARQCMMMASPVESVTTAPLSKDHDTQSDE